jgi:hypothetical protein
MATGSAMTFNKRPTDNDETFIRLPSVLGLSHLEIGHVLYVISGTFEFCCVAIQILTRTLFALVGYLIAVRMRDMGYAPAISIPPSYTFEAALHQLRPGSMLWE